MVKEEEMLEELKKYVNYYPLNLLHHQLRKDYGMSSNLS
jgi:hypothetical protein